MVAGVTGVTNNAALLAAYFGAEPVAWTLCERVVQWQHRLSRRSRDARVGVHVMQPWVNLGRLEALSGRWRASLDRFARLMEYRESGQLRLGAVRVNGMGWNVVAASRQEFEDVLENLYVIDTLKALLLNRRYVEVEEFAAGYSSDCRAMIARRLDEALIVATSHLGRFDRARSVADSAARQTDGWNRAVFKLRQAEVFAASGDTEGATSLLRRIVDVVRQVSPQRKKELSLLYVNMRLAASCAEVGLERASITVAREVNESARAAGDEVFQIESLRILAATAPADERSRWEEELARAEATTEYARYRRGGPPPPNPVIEGLYQQLEEVFSN